jgi:acetate kinase
VVNCGSSTIKYQLFSMEEEDSYQVLAKGIEKELEHRFLLGAQK